MGKALKWGIQTILVGFIPIFLRGFIYFILLDKEGFACLSVSDLIIWGLVIHLCIFHERDSILRSKNVRSVAANVPIYAIILYSVLFACSLISEKYNIFENVILMQITKFLDICSLVIILALIFKSHPLYKRKEIEGAE